MITTIHNTKTVNTNWTGKTKADIKKPDCIVNYNTFMKGID
jgi:hypothetical protein